MNNDIKKSVRHVANLAKLELSQDQLDKYSSRSAKIIEYFNKLNELDTTNTPPTSHAIDVVSILRNDEIVKFDGAEKILDCAPEKDGPFVQVPKVI